MNIAFIFPPFYDPNNIPNALAAVTHFNSNVPAFSDQSWVAGPFIDVLYVPGQLAYIASGYNLYWVYTTFKAIYAALTIVMAYAFYRVFEAKNANTAERIATFTLLNPALLLVSYIWVEYDIVPIAFVALGYVLLRFHPKFGPQSPRVLLPVGLIAVSIFFYWFALALIPALLFFTKTNRERLNLSVALVAVLLPLFLASVYLLGNNFAHSFGTLLGAVTIYERGTSFGLHSFIRISPNLYLGILVVSVLLLPLFLKSISCTEFAASFAVLSLLIFSNTTPQPDNYTIVFPFVILGYAHLRVPQIKLWRMLLAQSYALVGLFLINFSIWNAQPDGVGVLYWGYDIFHYNLRFIHSYAQQEIFQRWFNIACAAAIVLSLVVFLYDSRTQVSGPNEGGAVTTREPRPAKAQYRQPKGGHSPIRPWGRGRTISIASAGTAILIASLAFNATFNNLVDYNGQGSPPIYFVLPQYVPDNFNVVRPISNVTFSLTGNTVSISPNAKPLAFSRWFSAESVNLAGSIIVRGDIPRNSQLLNGTPFSAGVLNISAPNAQSATEIVPSFSHLVKNTTSPLLLLNRSYGVSNLSGVSYLDYNLTNSVFVDNCYTFSFNLTIRAPLQSNIFHIQGSQNAVAVVSYPGKTVLVFTGAASNGTFVSTLIPGVIPVNAWSFVSFCPSTSGISVDVNGNIASVNASLFASGTDHLVLGLPPFPNAVNNTFTGFVTPMYASTIALPVVTSYFATVKDSIGQYYSVLTALEIPFSIASNLTWSQLAYNGKVYSVSTQTTEFGVGKFTEGSYGVNITFEKFSMRQLKPNNYYLLPVFWTFASPFLILVPTAEILRKPWNATAG